jgi:hypothetical protein
MMGLACPETGPAGQVAGKALRPAGEGAGGIPRENHAFSVRAAIVENVSVPICVIARQTEQYRCRAGEARDAAFLCTVGWLIRNALTLFEIAAGYVCLRSAGDRATHLQISLTRWSARRPCRSR